MPRQHVFLLVAISCLACSGSNAARQPAESKTGGFLRTEHPDATHEIELFDINHDGRPDIWYVYERVGKGEDVRRTLLRKEIDLNFDGRVDTRMHYDANEQLVKEEKDTDFDSRVDHIDHYRDGQIELQEIDVGFDGKTDVWRHFVDGQIIRKERDTNDDGKVDFWEYYDQGALTRTGRDMDGDGNPDLYEEATTEAAP